MTTRKYFGTKKRTDLSDHERTIITEYKERFAKWHNKQIDLLTFSINLIFTISLAVSGFIISNQDKDIFKGKFIGSNYSLTKTTLCILSLSATLGLIALIVRLNDFRLTKNVIKTRSRIFELKHDIVYEATKESNKESMIVKRDCSIYWSEFLGKVTWTLFYTQIGLLIAALWIIIWNV